MSLHVWDPEAERLAVEADANLIRAMRIGQRVAARFETTLNERGRLVACQPYEQIGEIVALELHEGRSHVTIHFDGDRIPVGPFRPTELRLLSGQI